MNFKRYLKTEQQLILQSKESPSAADRTELMIVTVAAVEGNRLVVHSPYGSDIIDQYAIDTDIPVEITTDVMGMGARVTAHFTEKLSNNRFALQLDYDFSLFQRRVKERVDCNLGIRFSRGAKTINAMREIWKKNIEVLHSPEAPLIFQGFRSCPVNISSGGIRFALKPPASQGDLCLILINLDDGKPPVCTIAEVVWSCMIDDEAATTGMRFINILNQDKDRINRFVMGKK
ncbi:MAG: PilZ domain-containing protein [Pelovirga sp.]